MLRPHIESEPVQPLFHGNRAARLLECLVCDDECFDREIVGCFIVFDEFLKLPMNYIIVLPMNFRQRKRAIFIN